MALPSGSDRPKFCVERSLRVRADGAQGPSTGWRMGLSSVGTVIVQGTQLAMVDAACEDHERKGGDELAAECTVLGGRRKFVAQQLSQYHMDDGWVSRVRGYDCSTVARHFVPMPGTSTYCQTRSNPPRVRVTFPYRKYEFLYR